MSGTGARCWGGTVKRIEPPFWDNRHKYYITTQISAEKGGTKCYMNVKQGNLSSSGIQGGFLSKTPPGCDVRER